MEHNNIIPVTVPAGLLPGSTMVVVHNGSQVAIQVPEGAKEGDVIQVSIPTAQATAQATTTQAEAFAQVAQAQVVPVHAQAVQAIPFHTSGQVVTSGVALSGLSQNQVASGDDLAYAEMLLRSRAWVSCFAMMDCFLIILYIFTSLGWWGLLFMIGPLYGYYGARSLNAMNIGVYFVFKIIIDVVNIGAMAASTSTSQFVWSSLLILCHFYITWEVYKFWKMLRNVDEGALMRAMQQLHQHHHMGHRY
mmetsp:Transcript_20319/g.36805  ORF Transcript_20319/g.36805 Transcript_20319/m.36805 type:complete len:248 (+) Transcript_20319:56-799(+)